MPEDIAVLIAQTVEKAVQPYRERISSMEDTIALLREKTAALEATQATLSDNQFIQLKLINDLKEAAQKASQSAISAAASPGKKTPAVQLIGVVCRGQVKCDGISSKRRP